MTHRSRTARWLGRTCLAAMSLAAVMALTGTALANVALTTISTDPYTNTTSYHATQVEPDTFSFGSTIVAAMQTGRFQDGGASNIAVATSTNNGATWTQSFLPSTTVFATPPGPWDRITDPSVAYDPLHNVWMISTIALDDVGGNILGPAVLINQSFDGGLTWLAPVTVQVATGNQNFDKNWTVCDTWSGSPFFGNCYTEYDDFGNSNQVHMARSTNGGTTWTQSTVATACVIGGQPVVQPNGNVVMPIDNCTESVIGWMLSTNGGLSYSGPATFATIKHHNVAGNLREGPLPSAEVDAAGKVYAVWTDCRFVSGCKRNDIVMSTSTNGTTWSAVQRLTGANARDHFIPGIAVDRTTSGATAKITVAYYDYSNSNPSNCSASSCLLNVSYVQSNNGGTSFSAPVQLDGPMTLTWLPLTTQGYMVGDYISTSYDANHLAHAVFEHATATSCTLGANNCNEYTVTPTTGLLGAAETYTPETTPKFHGPGDPAKGNGHWH